MASGVGLLSGNELPCGHVILKNENQDGYEFCPICWDYLYGKRNGVWVYERVSTGDERRSKKRKVQAKKNPQPEKRSSLKRSNDTEVEMSDSVDSVDQLKLIYQKLQEEVVVLETDLDSMKKELIEKKKLSRKLASFLGKDPTKKPSGGGSNTLVMLVEFLKDRGKPTSRKDILAGVSASDWVVTKCLRENIGKKESQIKKTGRGMYEYCGK